MAGETITTSNNLSGVQAPAVEYVSMTDPQTQQIVKVPKELEAFIGHVASVNRKDGRRSVQEEMQRIQDEAGTAKDEIAQLRAKLGEKSESKQVENLKAEYEKLINAAKAEAENGVKVGQDWKRRYEDMRIVNDLLEAVSTAGYELYNSKQTIDLLRSTANARIEEGVNLTDGKGTGVFNTKLTLNITDESGITRPVDLSPQEAVKKFLSQPGNAFHLKNKLTPGAGSTGNNISGNASDGQARYEDAMKKGDLKEAIKVKQQMFGMSGVGVNAPTPEQALKQNSGG